MPDFSVLQEAFTAALKAVVRAVPTRPTLQVIGNIRLFTDGGELVLEGTNLEQSVRVRISAKVERDCDITLPARTLVDFVNTLSPDRVDITVNEARQSARIKCGGSVATIKGIDPNEYPLLPAPADDAVLEVEAAALRQVFRMVGFAAADDDNRPVLTAIYLKLSDGALTAASADGYRLAVLETAAAGQDFEVLLPARSADLMLRVLPDDAVRLTLTGHQAVFEAGHTQVATTLLDGKFPDYNAVVPKSHATQVRVYRDDWLRASRRAEIFARDVNNHVLITVAPAESPTAPGTVRMSASSTERGDAEAVVDATTEGEPLELGVNVRYLIDALNISQSDQVVAEFNGPTAPMVIRMTDSTWKCVLMPMSRRQ